MCSPRTAECPLFMDVKREYHHQDEGLDYDEPWQSVDMLCQ